MRVTSIRTGEEPGGGQAAEAATDDDNAVALYCAHDGSFPRGAAAVASPEYEVGITGAGMGRRRRTWVEVRHPLVSSGQEEGQGAQGEANTAVRPKMVERLTPALWNGPAPKAAIP